MCNEKIRKYQGDTICYRIENPDKARHKILLATAVSEIGLNLRSAMKYMRKNPLIIFLLVSTATLLISGWISFIEKDPVRNASGDTSFLTGPKERLVVIGTGLENREQLIDTKFDGVTFWT